MYRDVTPKEKKQENAELDRLIRELTPLKTELRKLEKKIVSLNAEIDAMTDNRRRQSLLKTLKAMRESWEWHNKNLCKAKERVETIKKARLFG